MTLNYIEALELVKKGEWQEAHHMIQQYSDRMSCLIHGYLHREEGDLGNAQYWYNRANELIPENSLDEEWCRLYDLVGGTAPI